MASCTACGATLTTSSRFCSSCGAPVKAESRPELARASVRVGKGHVDPLASTAPASPSPLRRSSASDASSEATFRRRPRRASKFSGRLLRGLERSVVRPRRSGNRQGRRRWALAFSCNGPMGRSTLAWWSSSRAFSASSASRPASVDGSSRATCYLRRAVSIAQSEAGCLNRQRAPACVDRPKRAALASCPTFAGPGSSPRRAPPEVSSRALPHGDRHP
jgi:hypothetical protein